MDLYFYLTKFTQRNMKEKRKKHILEGTSNGKKSNLFL